MGEERSKYWWHSLKEECPITLESLSTLPYPPFALTTGGNTISYFDGLALASYIVSRGIFQNPLTREDLTIADCRRLDDYLETYCYAQLSGMSSSRKISVAEAFALRSMVHVDTAIRDQSRARILQSTATAALAGLFVYGNDRRRRRQDCSRHEPPASLTRTAMPHQPEDRLILDWGFDLTRTVHDTSTEFASHGWTIIDDDEAMVVATEREAYQATQNAFPPLNNNNHSTMPNNDLGQGPSTDEHILQRVRELTIEEERERIRRQQQVEFARKRLLEEALARREERQRLREQQRVQDAAQWETIKQEQEEIQRARKEIEQWREEQWRKLRLVSEAQELRRVSNDHKSKGNGLRAEEGVRGHTETHDDVGDGGAVTDPQGEEVVDLLTVKKAKAAEKRKRAKQRKKEQKAEERLQQQKASKEQEDAAKKAASALKCGECGEGILDGGFEKYGRRFCSTKCARRAQPNKIMLGRPTP